MTAVDEAAPLLASGRLAVLSGRFRDHFNFIIAIQLHNVNGP